jgi:hypothetical protein
MSQRDENFAAPAEYSENEEAVDGVTPSTPQMDESNVDAPSPGSSVALPTLAQFPAQSAAPAPAPTSGSTSAPWEKDWSKPERQAESPAQTSGEAAPWEKNWDAKPPETGGGMGESIAAGLRGMREMLPFGQDIGAASRMVTHWMPFSEAKKEEVARDQALFEANKKAYRIGEGLGIVGQILAPEVGAVEGLQAVTAATKAPGLASTALKSAGKGAGIGALYGLGEGITPEERLHHSMVGGLTGGLVGGAVPAIGAGVKILSKKPMDALREMPIGSPEKAGVKKLSDAFDVDKSRGLVLSPEKLADAQRREQPVLPIDVGGPSVRGEARNVANLDQKAETQLSKVLSERNNNQVYRYKNFVNRLAGDVALDVNDTKDYLKAAAREANNAAYEKAYAAIPEAFSDPTLESVIKAPVGQLAAKEATRLLELERLAMPDSIDYPVKSLKWWDTVKKQLDEAIDKLYRAGDKTEGNLVAVLRDRIRNTLDDNIPEYARARDTAGDFFGQGDAFSSGLKYLSIQDTTKLGNVERLIRQLNPEQKKYFRLGVLQDLQNRVGQKNFNQEISNIFNKPNMHDKLKTALGEEDFNDFVGFNEIEQLMKQSSDAVFTGSTTMKQAARAGMNKIHSPLQGIVGGGILGGPLGSGAGYLVTSLAEHLKGSYDSKKAVEIASRLTSPDESIRYAAIKEVSRNPKAMSRISNIVSSINSMLSKGAGPVAGIGAARMGANEEVNRNRRASGGKVGKRDYPAKRLTRLEKAAQRAHNEIAHETKPLLDQPDEQIAHALEIASKTPGVL